MIKVGIMLIGIGLLLFFIYGDKTKEVKFSWKLILSILLMFLIIL